MDRVFVGYDHRQPVTFSVLNLSLMAQAKKRPISVTPLILDSLPITRQGLTPFTFSRFLVPWLCDYEGWALFMDADMILNADISELFDLADDDCAVMTIDTPHGFERASLMLFNCAHPDNKKLTPVFVENCDIPLHQVKWTKNRGTIPSEWNHLVLYDDPNPDAKLIHFTAGSPCFPETEMVEHAELWRHWFNQTMSIIPWDALMGRSVHKRRVFAHHDYLENGEDGETFNQFFDRIMAEKGNAA